MLLQMDSAHPIYTLPAWSELDNVLMEASFFNMQYVDLDFQFFFYIPPSTTPEDWQSRVVFEDARILPLLSTHPSIQFHFKTNTICTPQMMDSY